jgi:hypothetical protein
MASSTFTMTVSEGLPSSFNPAESGSDNNGTSSSSSGIDGSGSGSGSSGLAPDAPGGDSGAAGDSAMTVEENDSDGSGAAPIVTAPATATAAATATATAMATDRSDGNCRDSSGNDQMPTKRSRRFYCTTSSVYAENTISNPNHEQITYW